jgi:hypothetical protein
MSRSSRIAIFATALALTLSVASPAMAIVARWERLDVTLNEEVNGDVMLVSGRLPQVVELPANVVLAAPKGSKLQWAGEILGGPVEKDPEVKTSVTTSGSVDLYAFTLTKSRIGMLELSVPKAYQPTAEGTAVGFSYRVPANTTQVIVNVRIPKDASIPKPAQDAHAAPGPTGYVYYQQVFANVKAGTDVGPHFTYTTGANKPKAGGTKRASAQGGTFATVAFVIIAALLVYLVVHYFRRRPPVPPADDRGLEPETEATAAEEQPGHESSEEAVEEMFGSAPESGDAGESGKPSA